MSGEEKPEELDVLVIDDPIGPDPTSKQQKALESWAQATLCAPKPGVFGLGYFRDLKL